jgi:pimeloyl-ACP methyl ester carboxylesterase
MKQNNGTTRSEVHSPTGIDAPRGIAISRISHRIRGWASACLLLLLVMHFSPRLQTFAQSTKSAPIKNVILVHGAWADGSSWWKVIPELQAKGLHVVAVQLPLTSLADDVAAVKRAIALQDGPVLLVGHSYGGAVITEAGNDPKVAELLYVAAFAPGDGESVLGISKPFPVAPVGAEIRPDAAGYLKLTPEGIAKDFAQGLSAAEAELLTATQGPTNAACFGATITTAAWKSKPSWFIVAGNDRVISPELEKAEAEKMKATAITLPSGHLAMLSHPSEVSAFIEKAAADPGTK